MCQIQVIAAPTVTVHVDYEIPSVPSQCVAELSRYLQDFFFKIRRRADEDVRVTNIYGSLSSEQNLIRYQFGDLQEAEESMDEIGELIETALNQWALVTTCL